MWNCINCNETNEDSVELCRNCGSTVDGVLPEKEKIYTDNSEEKKEAKVYHKRKDKERKKGFFASLFDFTFTELVTTKIIKVIYILVVVFAGLGTIFIMPGLMISLPKLGLDSAFAFILPPFIFFFTIISIRIFLEALVAVHRIQEHAAEIAKQGRKRTE